MNQINKMSKEELISNIYKLSKEAKEVNNWENKTLPDFLEAMASWMEDMEGYYENTNSSLPENIPWNVFFDILMASRVYE